MTALRLGAFLHVVGAVFLTGYSLFWLVMAVTLRREEATDSGRLLGVVAAARWPPVGPRQLRLPLTAVGWVVLLAVALTGLLTASTYGAGLSGLVTGGGPWGGVMAAKLACLAILLAGQAGITVRPSAPLAYLNAAAAVAVLLFSAFLRH